MMLEDLHIYHNLKVFVVRRFGKDKIKDTKMITFALTLNDPDMKQACILFYFVSTQTCEILYCYELVVGNTSLIYFAGKYNIVL